MMSQKKNFMRAQLEKANRERSLHKEENYARIMEKREQQRSNVKLKNLLKERQIQFLFYKGMAIHILCFGHFLFKNSNLFIHFNAKFSVYYASMDIR